MKSTKKAVAEEAPNYSSKLKERVSSMLQAGRWTDCKFLVGTELQKVVEGHKNILASASPVFDAMFFGEMAENQTSIPIPDIQPATFKAMLRYIYTDDIKMNSLDKAFNVHYAAKKYILPNLEKTCITYIGLNLTPKNVCRAYEFALLFQENNLKTQCLQFMSTKTKNIFKDTNFEDIQLSTLVTIFSLEHVNCSALDMFHALEKYVKVQENHIKSSSDSNVDIEPSTCSPNVHRIVETYRQGQGTKTRGARQRRAERRLSQSQQQDTSKSQQDTSMSQQNTSMSQQVTRIKPEIRAALEKIPFLTLTAQEFAEGPAKSDLFTKSEVLAIIMNIASDKTNEPMPSGFCTSRSDKSPTYGYGALGYDDYDGYSSSSG